MLYKIYKKLRPLQRVFMKEVLVIGDSHAHVFEHWKIALKLPTRYFRICAVAGATISGIENPNSKTQALPIFMKALEKRYDTVIVMLGEVDAGFVIWYQAEKYGEDVSVIAARTLDKYTRFLSDVKKRSGRVIVVSTPLPSIEDGNDWGEIANLRKEVRATQLERTRLTLELNSSVRRYCEENKIGYLDLDERCMGTDGLLSDKLKNKDRADHHYDRSAYAGMIAVELAGMLR